MSFAIVAFSGAVLQAGTAVYGGIAQSSAASYSAKVAKINANQAGLQAQEAETAGRVQTDQLRLRTSALIAQAETAEAANGLQVGSGTPVNILNDISRGGTLDVEKSQANTALTAWGYRTQQTAFENQAQLDNTQSKQALLAGSLSAASSLLGGAAKYNTNVMGQPVGGDAGTSGLLSTNAPSNNNFEGSFNF